VHSVPKPSIGLLTSLCLLGWVSCSVYNEDLLKSAKGGAAGTPGVGGLGGGSGGNGGAGGDGTGGSAGTSSGGKGSGGSSGAGGGSGGGGSGGDGTGGTGGSGGKGNGGGGTGGDGSGGAAGKGGGTAGAGGSSGGAGGSAGTAGVGAEGGESGCPNDDCCPNDDTKVDEGACGCGVPDTDTDADTTADCLDGCDDDPAKTSPAECGCGVAETSCLPLKNSLIHRYSFDGTGTVVTDSIGTADGTVTGTGATLSGTGRLALAGGYIPAAMDPNKQHVVLPPGCLDGLTNATFEAWIDWTPPADGTNAQSFWQRIFDFGEDAAAGVGTYIFATPRASSATGPARASFTSSMGSTGQVYAAGGVVMTGERHVTVVVDDANNMMLLYVDGALSGSVAFPGALSAINDLSCYLGRSHFTADPYFAGAIDEFRVHDAAFTAADVTFSHTSGPNPAFL